MSLECPTPPTRAPAPIVYIGNTATSTFTNNNDNKDNKDNKDNNQTTNQPTNQLDERYPCFVELDYGDNITPYTWRSSKGQSRYSSL
jgi:hypothetical protein